MVMMAITAKKKKIISVNEPTYNSVFAYST